MVRLWVLMATTDLLLWRRAVLRWTAGGGRGRLGCALTKGAAMKREQVYSCRALCWSGPAPGVWDRHQSELTARQSPAAQRHELPRQERFRIKDRMIAPPSPNGCAVSRQSRCDVNPIFCQDLRFVIAGGRATHRPLAKARRTQPPQCHCVRSIAWASRFDGT